MSTSYEDIQFEEYLRDMEEGYNDAVSKVATSKNMKELTANLEGFQKFLRHYDEISISESGIQSLKESASAFATIQDMIKQIKPSKKQLFVSGCIGFVIGIAGNYISHVLFGG